MSAMRACARDGAQVRSWPRPGGALRHDHRFDDDSLGVQGRRVRVEVRRSIIDPSSLCSCPGPVAPSSNTAFATAALHGVVHVARKRHKALRTLALEHARPTAFGDLGMAMPALDHPMPYALGMRSTRDPLRRPTALPDAGSRAMPRGLQVTRPVPHDPRAPMPRSSATAPHSR